MNERSLSKIRQTGKRDKANNFLYPGNILSYTVQVLQDSAKGTVEIVLKLQNLKWKPLFKDLYLNGYC